MIITSQGFGHFTDGLNNQDFGIETPKMLLILDGCSEAKFSEVGTRLFAQLFVRKTDSDDVKSFEDNVKSVFDDIIEMMKKYYPTSEALQTEFIMENLLFTIIACFETEKEYIVKLFGDGYIITKNKEENVSYLKYAYGKCPPYFAYKYCNLKEFENYEFKTFRFSKDIFPKIAIATDGVMPIAKDNLKEIDKFIFGADKLSVEVGIKSQRQNFYDDVTIGVFGGRK